MNGRTIWPLILLTVLLSACSNGPNSNYEEFGDRANTRGFGHKYAQPENEDELVIGPADSINIQISNNPTLSGTQQVRIEGTITMPFVDQVKVAGLTPTQIRDKLEILLSPYIRNITIQVVPIDIQSKNIYVAARDLNDAINVFRIPVEGDMTLIDLISDLGGVPRLADDCHVRLIRGDPLHPKVLNINVRDMIQNGFTAANVLMRPDDIVYFPPDFFGKISIWVRKVMRPVREISASLNGIINTIDLIENGPQNNNFGGGFQQGGF